MAELHEARHVTSEVEAQQLAAHLNDPHRLMPVVVVSVAAGRTTPFVDVDSLVSALSGLAELFIIPTGPVSWAFSAAMPPQTQVYGGASRAYPVDLGWTTRPSESPLRFAYGSRDRERVTELLISDAMGMALAAGLLSERPEARLLRASGTVLGVAGGRAILDTDRGPGSVWPELTVPEVSADRLFAKGMRLEGEFDPQSRRLDVRASLLSSATLAGQYEVGSTVLGRVTRVDAGGCHVELVPGLRVFVDRRQALADPSSPLTELVSVDEVVVATVTGVGEPSGKGWKLDLIDVDCEAEPFAPALLAGGPAWLAVAPPAPAPAEAEPPLAQTAAAPEPVPANATPDELATQLAAMGLERDGLLAELAKARSRIDRLELERTRLRTQAREAGNAADRRTREVKSLLGQLAVSANDDHLFADPLDQFDFEVRLSWARRTAPDEKPALPLASYSVGDGFLASLTEVEGASRAKVVDVVVDVLTGRVHELEGRESHQLRQSEGPTAPYVTRSDGSTCWRVALQRNAPQARRLHYWQRPNGSVELSSVRKHDDMRP